MPKLLVKAEDGHLSQTNIEIQEKCKDLLIFSNGVLSCIYDSFFYTVGTLCSEHM